MALINLLPVFNFMDRNQLKASCKISPRLLGLSCGSRAARRGWEGRSDTGRRFPRPEAGRGAWRPPTPSPSLGGTESAQRAEARTSVASGPAGGSVVASQTRWGHAPATVPKRSQDGDLGSPPEARGAPRTSEPALPPGVHADSSRRRRTQHPTDAPRAPEPSGDALGMETGAGRRLPPGLPRPGGLSRAVRRCPSGRC